MTYHRRVSYQAVVGGLADTQFAADLCDRAAAFFHSLSFAELGYDLPGVVFRILLHVA